MCHPSKKEEPVDRRTLERSLVRRLLKHIDAQTTDMADTFLEVPCETYTSEQRHHDELDTLFLDQPLVLCMSGALPRADSYLALELCGTPILLTRDRQGKVHAMLNMCRHRGARVADGAGEANGFRCPFHAWTYAVDGRLIGVPVSAGFEGMCREDKGLVSLPVDEGYGLIVGRLRPGKPVHIDEYLGRELAHELSLLDVSKWQPFSPPHVHSVAANWKVTLDTYRENYHFNFLHRTTLKDFAHGGVLTFDAFGHHLRNCSAVRTIDALKNIDESEWTDLIQHFTYQYALFPNTSLTVAPRHLELWQILPVTSSTSQVLHTAYVRPDLTTEERDKAQQQIQWICQGVVDKEDFWVAARTEPGIRTGLVQNVVFGRNEPALQHLHRAFSAELAAAKARKSRAHTDVPRERELASVGKV
jgi:phenylpropionate dioxygenase-like ring-hydroxylating dioxygenase large terminal subunit